MILGKTTMPDYGMLSSGLSSFHALARNPWDLSKNPGGSSAGAGAAVAAGYGPLHVGTDIGGSVRLPAGWCGIFTLKPSLGRIPIDPPYAGRVRRADDAQRRRRRAADGRARAARRSRHDEPAGRRTIAWSRLERDVRGLSIGLLLDAGVGLPVDPEIAAAVEAAAERFEAAGAEVEPIGAVPHPRHARRHGRVLAHALLARHPGAAARSAAPRAAVHRRAGSKAARTLSRRRGVPRLQPDGGDARGRGRRAPAVRRRALADRADRRLCRRAAVARPTIRRGRSSTSASPSPTT